jgi:hypothetical protein
MKTVIEMAEEVGAYIAELPLENAVLFEVDMLSGRSAKLEAFAELVRADAFEQNRQEGMRQERALGELTKLEQEIEAPPERDPWRAASERPVQGIVAREQFYPDMGKGPFTTPPQHPWVDLTDEEMKAALISIDAETRRLPPGFKDFARAIEAKLKEKNT